MKWKLDYFHLTVSEFIFITEKIVWACPDDAGLQAKLKEKNSRLHHMNTVWLSKL